MERKLEITKPYIFLPICVGKTETKVTIFLEDEEAYRKKIHEFMVPVADMDADAQQYPCDYYAEIPIEAYLGEQLVFSADAPQVFMDAIQNAERADFDGQKNQCPRPLIHFAANTGWTNDPNGMIYADGTYHLYFQYNPFNTVWENMSWGHATSTDLLHWQQQDTVLFPDESGTMFSGCAISNEHSLLGLPTDALLFFYTAAGGSNAWSKGLAFTQKIAYSLDGGKTLVKMETPCLPTIEKENRDPKVYWHEETRAYIMVLFLEGNDFAIFRSQDLQQWEQSDRFTLDDAWECPDLLRLTSDTGEMCWFFWTADGFYYPGEFDGFHFKVQGKQRKAYVNKIPYAAQTYFGVADRTISIPWLRLDNDGRLFTGAYGLPVELICKNTENGYIIVQKPVRELMQQAKQTAYDSVSGEKMLSFGKDKKAAVLKMRAKEDYQGSFTWELNGSAVTYNPENGTFCVDAEQYQIGCRYQEFLFVVDDRILEVFFDGGVQLGTFVLKDTAVQIKIPNEAAFAENLVYYIEGSNT